MQSAKYVIRESNVDFEGADLIGKKVLRWDKRLTTDDCEADAMRWVYFPVFADGSRGGPGIGEVINTGNRA